MKWGDGYEVRVDDNSRLGKKLLKGTSKGHSLGYYRVNNADMLSIKHKTTLTTEVTVIITSTAPTPCQSTEQR